MHRPPSLLEIEERGRSKLPWHIVQYYGFSCGEGITQQAIPSAFKDIMLMPRALAGVDSDVVSTSTQVLGRKLATPIMIAPTAFHRLAHDEGELATARAGARCGAAYVYSMMLSNTSCQDVADAVPDSTRWAALYILKDRDYVLHIVRQAELNGFAALVVTCDHPTERVKRQTNPDFEARRTEPLRGIALQDRMIFPNAAAYRRSRGLADDDDSIGENDGSLTWEAIGWLVKQTKLPVVCKGILNPADAREAVLQGAQGIIVSNHGGRQMDCAPPAIKVLPAIVQAVRDAEAEIQEDGAQPQKIEVLLDSGIRTGTQVLKALAMGADAVLIGRPILWGLANAGQAGVEEVLDTLRQELADDMACVGCASISEIGPQIIYNTPMPAHCQ